MFVKLSRYIFTSKCERIAINCGRLLNNDIFLYPTSFYGIFVVRIWFNVDKGNKIGYTDAFLVVFVKM